MAFCLSFVNEKGGSGKSTWAIHTAWGLSLRGYSVCLVDTDPQQSALHWVESREEGDPDPFPVVATSMKVFDSNFSRAFGHYDFVIVDTPGRMLEGLGSVLKASDMACLTVRPSPVDLRASVAVAGLIRERVIVTNGAFKGFILPTAQRPNTRSAAGARVSLAGADLEVLPGNSYREDFLYPLAIGGCAYSVRKKGVPAVDECDAFVDRVILEAGL